MRLRHDLVIALSAAIAAGCGARTSLDAGDDQPTIAVPRPRGCESWAPGPITALSEAKAYWGHLRVMAEGDRVFVTLNDASTEYGDLLVASSALSTFGPVQTVIEPGMIQDLASGFGRRGALARVFNGDGLLNQCAFVPLAEDGSPAGPPSPIDVGNVCDHLVATPSGYAMVATTYDGPVSPPSAVTLVLLDPTGAKIGEKPVVPIVSLRLLGAYDDGSLLALSSTTEGSWLQHFDAEGDPLTEPQQLPTSLLLGDVVLNGSSGLLAFYGDHEVAVWPFDEGGLVGSSATSFGSQDVISNLTLAAAPHGALVIWTATPKKHYAEGMTVWAQPITTDGDLDGDVMDLTEEPLPSAFEAVGTPNGAVLVYEHTDFTDDTEQVFGRALCHR